MSNLFQRQLEVSLQCLTSLAEKQNQSKNFPWQLKGGKGDGGQRVLQLQDVK